MIFTTHLPTIVDMLDHEQVVLCRRSQGPRGLEVTLRQVPGNFFVSQGLDRDKYYKFHRRRNSDFLFADFVIVTESPIDTVVIQQVLLEAGAESLNGVSFVTLNGVTMLPYVFHLTQALGVAAAYIVDKDYFLPYKVNNQRSQSLDSRGYPQYGTTPKSDSLLDVLFPKAAARKAVVDQLISNHSGAMQLLSEVGLFCFRFAIEIDLVVAAEPRERLYDHFQVPMVDRNEATLLAKTRGLKAQEAMLKAVVGLDARKLPNSFKSIRRKIPQLAAAARVR